MKEKYICTLSPETECKYRNEDMTCSNDKEGCGFRKKKESKDPYAKKEKWFDIYYKRRNKMKK
jgi:hypothetical protein